VVITVKQGSFTPRKCIETSIYELDIHCIMFLSISQNNGACVDCFKQMTTFDAYTVYGSIKSFFTSTIKDSIIDENIIPSIQWHFIRVWLRKALPTLQFTGVLYRRVKFFSYPLFNGPVLLSGTPYSRMLYPSVFFRKKFFLLSAPWIRINI